MSRHDDGADNFLGNLQDYVTLQRVAAEFGLRMRGYRRQGPRLLVETDEGPKEAKRLQYPLEEYKFACVAAEFLRGQGFTRFPSLAWSPAGSPTVIVDGAAYTMHDWVPGTAADLNNLCQLTQAVEMLAWLHLCGRGFQPPADVPAARREWGSWMESLALRIQDFYRFEAQLAAVQVQDGDRFARHYVKMLPEFLTEAAGALQDLESNQYAQIVAAEKNRGGLRHRDYVGKNLFLREDGSLGVGDFAELSIDSRLADLGNLLVREGNWESERVLFILQVYHGVNPLSRAEIACLAAYMRFPHDFWLLAGQASAGQKADRHELKQLAAQLPSRRQVAADLGRVDLSSPLAPSASFYNLGFANLPEVPSGKAWTIAAGPAYAAAEPPPEMDPSWWPEAEAPVERIAIEPPGDREAYGTVLEETGLAGLGSSWIPEPPVEEAYFAPQDFGGGGGHSEAEGQDGRTIPETVPSADGLELETEADNPPVPAVIETASEDREPAVAGSTAWRAFPAPLVRSRG